MEILTDTHIFIKGHLQNGLDIDEVISAFGRYWSRWQEFRDCRDPQIAIWYTTHVDSTVTVGYTN
jgi:hypothetical protein